MATTILHSTVNAATVIAAAEVLWKSRKHHQHVRHFTRKIRDLFTKAEAAEQEASQS